MDTREFGEKACDFVQCATIATHKYIERGQNHTGKSSTVLVTSYVLLEACQRTSVSSEHRIRVCGAEKVDNFETRIGQQIFVAPKCTNKGEYINI